MSILMNQIVLNATRIITPEPVVPPKTIRFKFSNTSYTPTSGSSTSYTSKVGTWTAVDASQGIWDWYYNATDWYTGITSVFGERFTTSKLGGTADIIAGNLQGVTNVRGLFYGESYVSNALKSVSGLVNTGSISDIRNIFNSCTGLTNVDVFDTSGATNWNGMFMDCTSLTTLPVFDTSSIDQGSGIFRNCSALTAIPNMDFSNLNNANHLCRNCYKATNIKQIFDEICVSKAGLNGGFNTYTFQYAGRDSGNNQLSLIPDLIGGTKTAVTSFSTSNSGGSTAYAQTLSMSIPAIHPGDKVTISGSSSAYGGGVSSITISTSGSPVINKNASSGSPIQFYFGFPYSVTNSASVSVSFKASGSSSNRNSCSCTVKTYDY